MQDGLDEALERIEKEEIEYLMYEEGICPEDIVIAGMSEGGALAIWIALFSKYKLGGFIPMITSSEWLQLENWQIPEKPVNQWTPILHLNGNFDDQTKKYDAKGKAFMEKIFPNYEFRLKVGGHVTTFNALVVPEIVSWAQENTNLYFSVINPIAYLGGVAPITNAVADITAPITELVDNTITNFLGFWGR